MKKLLLLVLTSLCLFSVASCDDNKKDDAECKHENKTVEIVELPTCTKEGKEKYTCLDCGATWEEAIPMKEHTYVNGFCVDCGKEEPKE